jgi:ABC-type sugar transport system ATPase subunit
MNILQTPVEAGAAIVGETRLPAPGLAAYDGREVLLGIRPESLEDAAFVDGNVPRLPGKVELREALGSEVLVHFSTAGRPAATDELLELAEDIGDDRAECAGVVAWTWARHRGPEPSTLLSRDGNSRVRAEERSHRGPAFDTHFQEAAPRVAAGESLPNPPRGSRTVAQARVGLKSLVRWTTS